MESTKEHEGVVVRVIFLKAHCHELHAWPFKYCHVVHTLCFVNLVSIFLLASLILLARSLFIAISRRIVTCKCFLSSIHACHLQIHRDHVFLQADRIVQLIALCVSISPRSSGQKCQDCTSRPKKFKNKIRGERLHKYVRIRVGVRF